jgi:hypothetical protein
MKKIVRLIMVVILGLAVGSCYYDALPDEDYGPGGPDGPDTEVISYQNDIAPLWVQCTGCHKEGGDAPNMQDNSYENLLNGYVYPEDAATSILYKSLINDGVELMPPGSAWPTSKINLVRDWINQGALNN